MWRIKKQEAETGVRWGIVFALLAVLLAATVMPFAFPQRQELPKPTFTIYVQENCGYSALMLETVRNLDHATNALGSNPEHPFEYEVVDVATLSEEELTDLNLTRTPTVISSHGDRMEGYDGEEWALRWFKNVWNKA